MTELVMITRVPLVATGVDLLLVMVVLISMIVKMLIVYYAVQLLVM